MTTKTNFVDNPMEGWSHLEKGGPGSGKRGLQRHPNWSESDYNHLKGKGYNHKEIKQIWDKDKKEGKGPIKDNPKPTGNQLGNAANKYLMNKSNFVDNPMEGWEHLEKGRGPDKQQRKKRGTGSQLHSDPFWHHRISAAQSAIKEKELGNQIEDIGENHPDKDLRGEREKLLAQREAHSKKIETHLKEAEKLHNPQKHGSWNNSVVYATKQAKKLK